MIIGTYAIANTILGIRTRKYGGSVEGLTPKSRV